MESFKEITKIIHTYINNFNYQQYFYDSMNSLIQKYIKNNNLDECLVSFSSNYYYFKNLSYFYNYSINNKHYINNLKKLDDKTKNHLLEKGIKVLYNTYIIQINELINIGLINELFKNITLIKKYNYTFDSFKKNSNVLYKYLKNVYKISLKNE